VDIATLGGIAAGFFFILSAIVIAGGPASLGGFISVTSVLITIGGSFAAIVVSNTIPRIFNITKILRNALRVKSMEEGKIIATIVTFSEKARREGLLALEDDLDELEDTFLRKAIQLVVDGTDPEVIRNILETELNNIQVRHQEGIKIFEDWGIFAPAFGMIGTLIGLVLMLSNIEDKSAIGPGMSAALITTLYGAIIANLVFIPIANKLTYVNNQEILTREIMIEGTLSIQSGDNPRIVKEKLISFLPPAVREQVEEETGEKE